ncbi:MAG: hypothetical protein Q9200_007373 [Gallowayella weberi]
MQPLTIISSLFLILSAPGAYTAHADQWRDRSIYQLLTDRFATTNASTPCHPGHQSYCGGTWRGIIERLDYIQGMGFDAIWISPITKQIDDPSRPYHGYSQQDLYELNERFGTSRDLKDLAFALHARDMYLMVDIVINHFGVAGPADAVNYSSINPFNRQSDFHPLCFVSDWDNQTEVEKCWLGSQEHPLIDINTELPSVRQTYKSWIQELISNYSIDGFRIDTVKHVEKDFWSYFQAAADIYTLGEVASSDIDYVCPYQQHLNGVLNYPLYHQLADFFSNSSKGTADLASHIKDTNTTCKDPTLTASFSENHDQPRFANLTADMALAKNMIAFTMLADGIPIIYSGQEHHLAGGNDPYNRESIWQQGYHTDTILYKFIKRLHRIRKHAMATLSRNPLAEILYTDHKTVVLRKGSVVTLYTNRGASSAAFRLRIGSTGFAANSSVMEVLSTCRTVRVAGDGYLDVVVREGSPMVFLAAEVVGGLGLCD